MKKERKDLDYFAHAEVPEEERTTSLDQMLLEVERRRMEVGWNRHREGVDR